MKNTHHPSPVGKFRKHWLFSLPILLPLLLVGALYAYDLLIGVNAPYRARTQPDQPHPELGVEWRMHLVDNPGDWLPNGLDPFDVNGDGRDDYLVNYEYNGRIRVLFHPGEESLGGAWPAVDAGTFPDAESSTIGDLDNDGLPDLVIAHGVEHTDLAPGMALLWGKAGGGTYAWEHAGDLPSSRGGWQFLYVKTADLDGDEDADILAGGRATRLAGGDKQAIEGLVWAGIRWFENPGPAQARRTDLWQVHAIDPSTRSGHGFELGDIDQDGDLDLANANADWDTPDTEENLAWYENPGSEKMSDPWPIHVLYQGIEFFGKEQVVITDLDADGRTDLLTQASDAVYWFRGTPDGFEQATLPKHQAAVGLARGLEVADLNQDGRLDILAARIHKNGQLGIHQAAVFWIEQTAQGEWLTHIIKWGDGFAGMGTFNGEKWDQFIPADVDRDGDLDLVANCEEYNRLRAILSVVWFENPLIDP